MCLSLCTSLSVMVKLGQGELRQACHYTLKHPPCKQFSPDTAMSLSNVHLGSQRTLASSIILPRVMNSIYPQVTPERPGNRKQVNYPSQATSPTYSWAPCWAKLFCTSLPHSGLAQLSAPGWGRDLCGDVNREIDWSQALAGS